MKDTGRIQKPLLPSAWRAVYGTSHETSAHVELPFISTVDRAHLIMLSEQGILPVARVARVIEAIDQLARTGFEALRGVPAPRGTYLAYEDHLIGLLGADGGILQTARSRNDLNATVLRLRLRAPFVKTLEAGLQLLAMLSSRAARWGEVVMPIYTHRQPAMPGSLGHYLAGLAYTLLDDIDGIWSAHDELQCSPLGAGAAGGTELPINPSRSAALLGFSSVAMNSIAAVASRQFVLRILSALAILGVTLSRFASDWSLWATSEFGFLSFPDELVGSSSAMPQKRNPFLLEHIEGRTARSIGAFVEAAAAMRSAPFTNAISVGTEGVHALWPALEAGCESLELARLVVQYAQPQEGPMRMRALEGYTVATALANRAVMKEGNCFREAHCAIGSQIRKELEAGVGCDTGIRTELSPADAMHAADFGGGPGPSAHRDSLHLLRRRMRALHDRVRHLARHWQRADEQLGENTRRICEPAASQSVPNDNSTGQTAAIPEDACEQMPNANKTKGETTK